MGAVGYVRDAWARRELLRQLAWGQTKAGRRQSVLGLAWVFVRPVAYLLVLSIVFSRIPRASGSGVPYPLFLLAGLVPWLFLSGALAAAVGSVVGMSGLVRKVAFPRIFCPLSVMSAHLTDLLAGLILLAGLMVWWRVAPTWQALWIVPLLMVTATLAMGLGFLFAALNVHTRDIGSVVPLLIQVWFFATPIIYPLEWVRGPLERAGLMTIYRLNPMVGVTEGFRGALLRGEAPGTGVALAAGVALAVFCFGALVFTRLERTFADVV